MPDKTLNKITVIGAGFVGTTCTYTLMMSGLANELVLIDVNKKKAEGEIMDLNHGLPFVSPVKLYSGDYSDTKDSDIIIITAGANQKEGESRIDLLNRNTEILKSILNEVTKYNSECILLVVTNPVDILTYITYKLSGFPKNKVLGSGTVLDTARFKYMIGEHTNIDSRNVHTYIIGEHGDTEVPAWSLTNIAGMSVTQYCEYCKNCESRITMNNIFDEVKSAAYKIIERKGATYYAIALAVKRIVEAIVRDENSILTVSSFMDGQYGISDICLSVPTVVNSTGIERVLEVPISNLENDELKKSANALKDAVSKIIF